MTKKDGLSIEKYSELVNSVRIRDFPYVLAENIFELRDWIRHLDPKQGRDLITELLDFAADGKIKNRSFSVRDFEHDARSHAAKSMVNFTFAMYQRNNLLLLKKIKGYLRASSSKQHDQFGWQLYMLMVESGLCEISGEFLLAGNKERKVAIQNAIVSALADHPDMLIALAREANAVCGMRRSSELTRYQYKEAST